METAVLDNAFIGKNVRRARNAREMDLKGLSAELTELGHPMGVSALSKLENGDRKVLADDLPFLAAALGVTPNVLLLGDGTREDGPAMSDPIRVAGKWEIPLIDAWRWVQGEKLPRSDAEDGVIKTKYLREDRELRRRGQPHDPPFDFTLDEMSDLDADGVFAGLLSTVEELRRRGIPLDALRQRVKMIQVAESLRQVGRQWAGEAADVRDMMGGTDESSAS